MKIIHSLLATIAFGAFAVNVALAERPGPAKRSPITGIAKDSIAARALEQVRKGIPPSLLEHPGKGIAASPLERSKKGIAAAAMGHARNRHQDSGAQAIGGLARNAIGLRVRSDTTAGGRGPGPMALGATTIKLPGVHTPGRGQTPGRAAIIPPAGAIGSRASVSPASAAPLMAGSNPGIRGGISGTGLVRIGSGPAVVGGLTVKSASINGTSMRPKH